MFDALTVSAFALKTGLLIAAVGVVILLTAKRSAAWRPFPLDLRARALASDADRGRVRAFLPATQSALAGRAVICAQRARSSHGRRPPGRRGARACRPAK
jgi:hypothetical protein